MLELSTQTTYNNFFIFSDRSFFHLKKMLGSKNIKQLHFVKIGNQKKFLFCHLEIVESLIGSKEIFNLISM